MFERCKEFVGHTKQMFDCSKQSYDFCINKRMKYLDLKTFVESSAEQNQTYVSTLKGFVNNL